MSTSPPVSFVMPVHNAQPFLDESVGSILNQTLADFEFVILDDGSNDGPTEALREWARGDARIRDGVAAVAQGYYSEEDWQA